MVKAKKPKTKKVAYEELGKMMESIYESGYIDRNKLYKMSFIKGVVAGFGGVIGATIVVVLLLWVLSWFDGLPVVGPFFDDVKNTIDTNN